MPFTMAQTLGHGGLLGRPICTRGNLAVPKIYKWLDRVLKVREVLRPTQIQDGRIWRGAMLLEKVGEVLAQNCLVLKSVAEILGEGTFPRSEEGRYPDADTFVRFGGGFGDGPEQLVVLLTDAVRG